MYKQIDCASSYLTRWNLVNGNSIENNSNMHRIWKAFFNKEMLVKLYWSIENAEQKLNWNSITDIRDNTSDTVQNILN
jgi:hypothetical protein